VSAIDGPPAVRYILLRIRGKGVGPNHVVQLPSRSRTLGRNPLARQRVLGE